MFSLHMLHFCFTGRRFEESSDICHPEKWLSKRSRLLALSISIGCFMKEQVSDTHVSLENKHSFAQGNLTI